jgi:peptide/nickel transport system permease protein
VKDKTGASTVGLDSGKGLRDALRFVPGARVESGYWLAAVFAAFFYFYLSIVVAQSAVLSAMARSPITVDRLRVVGIIGGLVLTYLMAILPQVYRRRTAEKVWGGVMRRFQTHRMGVLGMALFMFFLVVSLLAPLLAPYHPAAQPDPVSDQYQAPSRLHPMGTDKFGRDILTRVLYGSQTSLAVALLAVSLATLIGLFVGAFSGYLGGWVDDLTMPVVDRLLAFPRLLLVLTVVAFFARSFWVVVLLLALTGWMGVSRLVRGEVLRLKEQDFIHAAVATGVSRGRVVWKHIVPNTLGPVVISATLRIGTIILLESYLSFLGLGVQPPAPSWGGMVFDGRDVLLSAWWVSAFPGLAIVLAVMACNLVGDGLRDALDVKTTG